MRFRSLDLRNFTCYADATVDLGPGVTVIHGVNGSGKSSLLEACFFVLYGARALSDRTLEDVITRGAEETEIELAFSHAGADYTVYRRLRVSGDRVQTVECTLRTPEETIDGARAVRNEIASMLRMDADAFLNCAYVRQGEVNKLIHASPGERQDMLDELLQLGVLEEYRDRAAEARRGVASIADERAGQLEQVSTQIAEKDEDALTDQLNALRTEQQALDADIDRLEGEIETTRERREEAETVIETAADHREELTEVEDAIAELTETIEQTVTERDDLRSELTDASDQQRDEREQIETLHTELDISPVEQAAAEVALEDLDERDAELRDRIETIKVSLQEERSARERAQDEAEDLTQRAAELSAEAEERAAELDAAESEVADLREQLGAVQAERDEVAARFDDGDVSPETVDETLAECRETLAELREQRSDVDARIEGLAEDIREAESLAESGRCPTCGQPVGDAPAVEHLETHREDLAELEAEREQLDAEIAELTDEIEGLESLADDATRLDRLTDQHAHLEERLERHTGRCEELEARIAELREEAATYEEEAEDRRAAAAEHGDEIEGLQAEIAAVNEDRATLRDRRERVEELLTRYERLGELEDEMERLRDRREQVDELLAERRDRLGELRERRDELADAVDDDRLERARAIHAQANTLIAELTTKREQLQARRDTVIDRIGRVENALDELDTLEARKAALEEETTAIDTLHEETAELEAMYGDLRRDLRERNVAVLEELLNETFALVYRNDAYDRIHLDPEYRFTVVQKDGEELAPAQLSGGERALFNLSLRCAIYRLLAEGIEGGAPLPPLIFDEPTVFLDSGHVSQLVTLIESMRDIGVEQIIVVTHDRELLGAADAALRVDKDPRTNESTVHAEADREQALPQD